MPDRTEGLTHHRENVTQITYEPQEVEEILTFIGFDLDEFRKVLLENGDSFFIRSDTFLMINLGIISGVEIKIDPTDNLVVELVLDFGGEKIILIDFRNRSGRNYILHHAGSSTYMNSPEEVEFMQALFGNIQSSVPDILASCSTEAS